VTLYLIPGVLNVAQDWTGRIWQRRWVRCEPGEEEGAINGHRLIWVRCGK
jgi:hypothetical protein